MELFWRVQMDEERLELWKKNAPALVMYQNLSLMTVVSPISMLDLL